MAPEPDTSSGTSDQDDPFPVYATFAEFGALHAVTLDDGHAAWFVACHDEAHAALNDRRLPTDTGAAPATGNDIVAGRLLGPSFARDMHLRPGRCLRRRSPRVMSPRRGNDR
jgi:hypothetical protein